MSAAVDVTTGLAITFSSGFLAQIIDVNWNGISRGSIPTSHMGTAAPGAGQFGNMTYIPAQLSDPGEVSVEIHFNPDTLPPIDAASETVTITFDKSGGNTTGANWAASGFMTAFEVGLPLEDKMTATVTLKMSGNVTRTAGS